MSSDRRKVICNSEDHENRDFHWNGGEKLKWMLTFFVGNVLLYSARSTMSICVPAISKELSWNKQISGMALSAFFVGYLCTNMIGGHIADKIGGEVVICYAGIGWASLTAFLPFIARSHILLITPTVAVIVSRFLTGLSQGVFYPSMSAITSKHLTSAEKGFFVGFTNSGAFIGSAATGLFGSIILEKLNWSVVFIIIGSLSVLWILWLRYLISFRKNVNTVVQENIVEKEHLPWRPLVSSGPFWGLFIAYFTGSYCFNNMLSWTPVYFQDTFPESKGWLFNTIPWFVAFLLSNITGYLGNLLIRKGVSVTFIRKLFATLQLLGFSLCSISLNYVTTFHQALFITSLNIAANAFSICSLTLNSQDLAPAYAGVLHGFMNGFGAVAGVIGVYLTGYILESTEHWSWVFLLNSTLTFIGCLSFLIFGSGERVI